MTDPRERMARTIAKLETFKVRDKIKVPSLQDFLTLVRTKNLSRTERFFVTLAPPGSIVNPERLRDMMLLCEEAAIPGKTIGTRTLRINGLNEQRAHNADYMGDSLTLQFLVDTDWTAKVLIDEWMELCIGRANSGREIGWYQDYIGNITLRALVPGGIPGEEFLNRKPTPADKGTNSAINEIRQSNNLIAGPMLSSAFAVGKKQGNRLADKLLTSALSNPIIMDMLRETESVAYTVRFYECWPRAVNVMPVGYGNIQVHRVSVTFTYKYWEANAENAEQLDEKSIRNITETLYKQYAKFANSDESPPFGNLGEVFRNP